MKKNLFVYCFIIACSIQSCKKDNGSSPVSLGDRIKNSSGFIAAKVNGVQWTSSLATANYISEKKAGITGQKYYDNYLHETISIEGLNLLSLYSGIYYSTPYVKGFEDSTTALFSKNDDDAIFAEYNVLYDSSAHNYITIDDYNAATHEVKGRFQISFYLDYSAVESQPDTLHFTEGSFSITIK